VIAFAEAHGLAVDEVNQERRQVTVSGTGSELNRAFHVDLGHYRHSKQNILGMLGPFIFPLNLQALWKASSVSTIDGLLTPTLPAADLVASP